MRPKVNFTVSGNSYTLNTPNTNNLVTTTPYRTGSLSYTDTYGATGLRTSGLTTAGRYQAVENFVRPTQSFMTTQVPTVQEVRVAGPTAQVVRAPTIMQERVGTTSPSQFQQRVVQQIRGPQLVQQHQVAQQAYPVSQVQVATPPQIQVAANQSNYHDNKGYGEGFLSTQKEPKKKGCQCSNLLWALLGLLALLGLTLGLLFGLGVIGGKKVESQAPNSTQPITVPPISSKSQPSTVSPTAVSPVVSSSTTIQPIRVSPVTTSETFSGDSNSGTTSGSKTFSEAKPLSGAANSEATSGSRSFSGDSNSWAFGTSERERNSGTTSGTASGSRSFSGDSNSWTSSGERNSGRASSERSSVQFVSQTLQNPTTFLRSIPFIETRPVPVTHKTELQSLENI